MQALMVIKDQWRGPAKRARCKHWCL